MKRLISGISASALALAITLGLSNGCASSGSSPQGAQTQSASPKPSPEQPVRQPMAEDQIYYPVAIAEMPAERIIAKVNGQPITLAELQRPLLEGYGLRVLLFQTQLQLARQKAKEQKVTYTRADVEAELDRTMKIGFKDAAREDYPALLSQLLERQGVSRAEFDMIVETNTILRRIAEPQLKGKITEENLQDAFNAVYGETAVIKHIQTANPQEAMQAKTRLAAGEKWEDIVRNMSRNVRTAALDGELPPFSRSTTQWPSGWGKVPEGFKAWVFGGAKVGDVSDPVQADGAYHILKLERKIQPKVVKYEDVKETLRGELYQKLVDQGVNELRNQLGAMVKRTMVIEEPTLRKQYETKLAEQEKSIKEEDRIRGELRSRIKEAEEAFPATRPAAATTLPAATRPAATQSHKTP